MDLVEENPKFISTHVDKRTRVHTSAYGKLIDINFNPSTPSPVYPTIIHLDEWDVPMAFKIQEIGQRKNRSPKKNEAKESPHVVE